MIVAEFASYIQFCFLACYVAFVFTRPKRISLLLVTGIGLVLGLILTLTGAGTWMAGLGIAAAAWAILAPYFGRKSAPPVITLFILYPAIASVIVFLIHSKGGRVLDRYLLAADGSFGFQPGFRAAAYLYGHPEIRVLCETFYLGLPVAVASLIHTPSSRRFMITCGLLAASAVVGFTIFPAVGAQVAFAGRFPDHPPASDARSAGAMYQPAGSLRNLMPSLHTAWGLALVLAVWPLARRWRLAMALYLAPMLMYALAMHYLCDMIVAVPWTLMITSALDRRWARAALYAFVVAGWMLLIRFGLAVLYSSVAVPWVLLAATLAMPAFYKIRVNNRQLEPAEL